MIVASITINVYFVKSCVQFHIDLFEKIYTQVLSVAYVILMLWMLVIEREMLQIATGKIKGLYTKVK